MQRKPLQICVLILFTVSLIYIDSMSTLLNGIWRFFSAMNNACLWSGSIKVHFLGDTILYIFYDGILTHQHGCYFHDHLSVCSFVCSLAC